MTGWVLILLYGKEVHAEREIIAITNTGDLQDGKEESNETNFSLTCTAGFLWSLNIENGRQSQQRNLILRKSLQRH